MRRTSALFASLGISLGTYGLMGAAGAATAQTGSVAAIQAKATHHQIRTPNLPPVNIGHTVKSPTSRLHPAFRAGPRASLRATPVVAASYAHTYDVNSPGDTADSTPGNNVCADSTGKCTLRAAVEEADADTGATVINIPSGMKITLSSALDPITNSVQINGSGATVDGGGQEVFDITTASGSASPAVGVTGLTVTGDVSSDSEGAIYVSNGALTLTGVTITGNDLTSGSGWGAAVYNDYDGSLWMFASKVTNNRGNFAAGIYNRGAAYIADSTIAGNSATNVAGGLFNDGNAVLDNVTVSGNRVTGADGYSAGIYSDELLQLTGGSVDHNVMENGGYGAALVNEYIAQLANVAIDDNAILQGTGQGAAGSAIASDGEALNLSGVTMAGNSATTSGPSSCGSGCSRPPAVAGTDIASQDAVLSVSDTTISATTNNATAGNGIIEGGAVFFEGGTGSFKKVTINGTSNAVAAGAVFGGAIANGLPVIYGGSGVPTPSTLDLTGLTLDNTSNTGSYVAGGAAWFESEFTSGSSTPTLSEATLSDTSVSHTTNHASATSGSEVDGGALWLDTFVGLDHVSVAHTFDLADLASAATPSNTESDILGGAVLDYDYGQDYGYEKSWSAVSITDTTARAVGGHGYVEGGAVDSVEGMNVSDTQIVGATVQADSGVVGGGIANWDNFQGDRFTVADVKATVLGGPDAGTPYLEGASMYDEYMSTFVDATIANATGSAPSAASEASGVYNDDESTMTNVTMAGNSLAGPSGHTYWLYNNTGWDTKLLNSIVASTTPAANCGGAGHVISAGYNIDNGHSCGFTNNGDKQNTNPKVDGVANNGGLVETAALAMGSPAIDAGTNGGCPPTDARGMTRPFNGRCDIGAFEWSPANGYRFAASDGGVFSFHAPFYGSLGGVNLAEPIVAMADDPATGGYWLVASDGGVFAFNAPFYGSLGGTHLQQPIVGIAAAPHGNGYWLVAKDGGVFAFGPGAAFHGSTGGVPLTSPVVGMATDAATGGYWLVASDGGIFAFDAPFYGSTGGIALDKPIVGMAADAATGGYWLVASDGGIFAFDAPFYGSTGGIALDKPIVAIAPDEVTGGYRLVASDGGVFDFHAPFFGSTGGVPLAKPIVTGGSAA